VTAAASVGVPIPPHPKRAARVGRSIRLYVPAIVVAVGTIGLWELLIRIFEVRAFILPAPSAIAAALLDNWGAGRWPLFLSAQTTLFEAVGGLVIGTAVRTPPGARDTLTPQLFLRPPAGYALAAMNFLVTADGPNASIVTTETRVFAIGPTARRRFATYWRVIYPGSAIIRRMWLRAIRQRAMRPP